MAVLFTDRRLVEKLLDDRHERNGDRHDEVWEGLEVVHFFHDDEHQAIRGGLNSLFIELVGLPGLGGVRMGVNLAADAKDWRHDFRCPDYVVFLNGSKATCHDMFWTGPPDLLVEVVSPNDKSREKIDFYADRGTRELLFIDREPWRLDLHRHNGEALPVVASCGIDSEPIASESLPVSFQLVAGDPRPRILVRHAETGREWTV